MTNPSPAIIAQKRDGATASPPGDLSARAVVKEGAIETTLASAASPSRRFILDWPVEDIVDFKEKSDFETCEQLAFSYNHNALTIEQLEANIPALGFEFLHSPEFFASVLDRPGAQFLAVVEKETNAIQGAALYSTHGVLPEDFEPFAEQISEKLGTDIHYNVGFVTTAWIDPNARRDALYTPLTARMMQEMFDVHRLDYILAYYRIFPSENRAIAAHKSVGWESLDLEFTVDLSKGQVPSGVIVDPKYDNREREALLTSMGGLRRGVLVYRREEWEARGKEMLASKHEYRNDDDPKIFTH